MNLEIKEGLINLRRLVTIPSPTTNLEYDKFYYYRSGHDSSDLYTNKYSIFNDECLNIRYTLELLNEEPDTPNSGFVGNIINETVDYTKTYQVLIPFKNESGIKIFTISTPLRSLYDSTGWLLNKCIVANGFTHTNIITKVINVRYNYDYLNKYLGIS